ncbi:MAG: hypothetical protein LPJ89_08740, partial [Hymenobacteraceae bacterium]|nr:hypothetical protein [Hymenobacteraceae bacterium]
MIHHDFPDLNWLKNQIAQRFAEVKDKTGKAMQQEGWPVVIINAKTQFCDRPDIRGPFSIFCNISGSSWVEAGGRKVKVNDSSFFISNKAQNYTLQVDNPEITETFNFHLGQDLWEDFVFSQSNSDSFLLDNPFENAGSLAEFPNLLQLKNAAFQRSILHLHRKRKTQQITGTELTEDLVPLLQVLVQHKQDLVKRVQQIPAIKATARAELFKRVALATDFMLSYPNQDINLTELARLACLSKFHFLRAFAAV